MEEKEIEECKKLDKCTRRVGIRVSFMEFIEKIKANEFLKTVEEIGAEDTIDAANKLLQSLVPKKYTVGELSIRLSEDGWTDDYKLFYIENCHVELFGYWRYFFDENLSWANSYEESSDNVASDVRDRFISLYEDDSCASAIDESYAYIESARKEDPDFSVCRAPLDIIYDGDFEELWPNTIEEWYEDCCIDDDNDFVYYDICLKE